MANRLVRARVARPQVPIVYLDLNHFINLAKALEGKAPPGYGDLLDAAMSAVSGGRVVIPLSAEHVWETSKIKDPGQRASVARIMEKLSGFRYLLGRPQLARFELVAGLERLYGDRSDAVPPLLIGFGFRRAFGVGQNDTFRDDSGQDVTSRVKTTLGSDKFAQVTSDIHLRLERAMLDGPADADIPELRTDGYAPEVALKSEESRLEYEMDLSRHLIDAPQLRRGRLRDIVSAREVFHEWLPVLTRVCEQRKLLGMRCPDDDESFRALFAAMPQVQISSSIKTKYHRDQNHRWTTNDIADIDALAVAVPYCDVVFTDKAVRAAVESSKELAVIGTWLPRHPQELTQWLRKQPVPPEKDLLIALS